MTITSYLFIDEGVFCSPYVLNIFRKFAFFKLHAVLVVGLPASVVVVLPAVVVMVLPAVLLGVSFFFSDGDVSYTEDFTLIGVIVFTLE